MAASVFFAPQLPSVGAEFVLDGDEGRHAATVRRMRIGERLVLTDGVGGFAHCVATATSKSAVTVDCESVTEVPAADPYVVVVQAIPKSDRAELAVELATEAGVDEIIPWQASRCVARWSGKADKAVQRWRLSVRAAATQSRRARFPVVRDLHSTAELASAVAALVESGAKVLVLHEEAATPLKSIALGGHPIVVLIVGPEGGLAPEEVAVFTGLGAAQVMLGPTVLRTSTAAAVALGAIGVLTTRWDGQPVA